MTETAIVHTDLPDSHAAGTDLGTAIADALHGLSPDVVILFASSRYDYAPLLAALGRMRARIAPRLVVRR